MLLVRLVCRVNNKVETLVKLQLIAFESVVGTCCHNVWQSHGDAILESAFRKCS